MNVENYISKLKYLLNNTSFEVKQSYTKDVERLLEEDRITSGQAFKQSLEIVSFTPNANNMHRINRKLRNSLWMHYGSLILIIALPLAIVSIATFLWVSPAKEWFNSAISDTTSISKAKLKTNTELADNNKSSNLLYLLYKSDSLFDLKPSFKDSSILTKASKIVQTEKSAPINNKGSDWAKKILVKENSLDKNGQAAKPNSLTSRKKGEGNEFRVNDESSLARVNSLNFFKARSFKLFKTGDQFQLRREISIHKKKEASQNESRWKVSALGGWSFNQKLFEPTNSMFVDIQDIKSDFLPSASFHLGVERCLSERLAFGAGLTVNNITNSLNFSKLNITKNEHSYAIYDTVVEYSTRNVTFVDSVPDSATTWFYFKNQREVVDTSERIVVESKDSTSVDTSKEMLSSVLSYTAFHLPIYASYGLINQAQWRLSAHGGFSLSIFQLSRDGFAEYYQAGQIPKKGGIALSGLAQISLHRRIADRLWVTGIFGTQYALLNTLNPTAIKPELMMIQGQLGLTFEY